MLPELNPLEKVQKACADVYKRQQIDCLRSVALFGTAEIAKMA